MLIGTLLQEVHDWRKRASPSLLEALALAASEVDREGRWVRFRCPYLEQLEDPNWRARLVGRLLEVGACLWPEAVHPGLVETQALREVREAVRASMALEKGGKLLRVEDRYWAVAWTTEGQEWFHLEVGPLEGELKKGRPFSPEQIVRWYACSKAQGNPERYRQNEEVLWRWLREEGLLRMEKGKVWLNAPVEKVLQTIARWNLPKAEEGERRCKYCGAALKPSKKERRRKETCSLSCRVRYSRALALLRERERQEGLPSEALAALREGRPLKEVVERLKASPKGKED